MLLRNYLPPLKLGAKVLPSEIAGFGWTTGNVYYVIKKTETYFSKFLKDYQCTYSDSSKAVCIDEGGTTTSSTTAALNTGIQDALDKCVANRNDYVLIMPSLADYDIGAALTMSKKCVHLICPGGLGYSIGATNAARIHQLADDTIIDMSAAACEVAGLYFKNYVKQYAIDASIYATVYATNIHHNFFSITMSSTDGLPLIGSSIATANQQDQYSYGRIERNKFLTVAGTGTLAKVIDVSQFAVGCDICYNDITTHSTMTITVGIYNYSVGGHTDFNTFGASGGTNAAQGGVITNGLDISVSGNAIGNRGAIAGAGLVAGGTADNSFCDNRSATDATLVTASGEVQA